MQLTRDLPNTFTKSLDEILFRGKEVSDSMKYASYIQSALLPNLEKLSPELNDYFLYFNPRELVGGDFYYVYKRPGCITLVVGDCTGHGVPGALMSVLGLVFTQEIITAKHGITPDSLLNHLRERVMKALHQTGTEHELKDGMDIAVCQVFPGQRKVLFSGANASIYLVGDKGLTTYKPDKMPIGISPVAEKPFSLQEIPFTPGDMLYMASDGFSDQFGGERGKKFKSWRFRDLLFSIQGLDGQAQKAYLEQVFLDWKRDQEQVDDVLVLGARLQG